MVWCQGAQVREAAWMGSARGGLKKAPTAGPGAGKSDNPGSGGGDIFRRKRPEPRAPHPGDMQAAFGAGG